MGYESVGHGAYEMTWQRDLDCQFYEAITKLLFFISPDYNVVNVWDPIESLHGSS